MNNNNNVTIAFNRYNLSSPNNVTTIVTNNQEKDNNTNPPIEIQSSTLSTQSTESNGTGASNSSSSSTNVRRSLRLQNKVSSNITSTSTITPSVTLPSSSSFPSRLNAAISVATTMVSHHQPSTTSTRNTTTTTTPENFPNVPNSNPDTNNETIATETTPNEPLSSSTTTITSRSGRAIKRPSYLIEEMDNETPKEKRPPKQPKTNTNTQPKCTNCPNPGTIATVCYGYVCEKCHNKKVFHLISKTYAKKYYFFNDNDVANLPIYYRNTKWKTATCYRDTDLNTIASRKYNINNINDVPSVLWKMQEEHQHQLEARRKSINEHREERYNQRIQRQIKRKEKLIKALNDAGVAFRDDSELCKLYIQGEPDIKLDFVVRRMSEMKYLYEYCHMKTIKDAVFHRYYPPRDYSYYGGGGGGHGVWYSDSDYRSDESDEDPDDDWFGDRSNWGFRNYYPRSSRPYVPPHTVSDEAEKEALRRYGQNGGYPAVFPWQHEQVHIIDDDETDEENEENDDENEEDDEEEEENEDEEEENEDDDEEEDIENNNI